MASGAVDGADSAARAATRTAGALAATSSAGLVAVTIVAVAAAVADGLGRAMRALRIRRAGCLPLLRGTSTTSDAGLAEPVGLGPFARRRVPEDAPPVRLDRWVMKHVCSNWDAAQKLIASRQVWVVQGGEAARADASWLCQRAGFRFRPSMECKGSTKVQPSDCVYFPRDMTPTPRRRASARAAAEPRKDWLARRLLYKDTDFLAIDKPAGWSVTPGKHVGDLHLQRHLHHLQFGLDEPPRLVHRLSTEMGGVLLLARHRAAAAFAKDSIRQRAFWQRAFWAVVCGRVPSSGSVNMPLAKEQRGTRMVAKPCREDDGGLAALTQYSSLRYSPLGGGLSLLELNPYSGRHHQVRAHCAYGLRVPVLGDPLYYDLSDRLNLETEYRVRYHSEDARRERKQLLGAQPPLQLHCRQMMIKTFAGKDVLITAPLPPEMERTFAALGWSDFARRADRKAKEFNPWRPEEDQHLALLLAEADQAAAIEEERAEAEAEPSRARDPGWLSALP
ncbi:unnamed protein product [Prorocentrum cordatum]|uniref:Pseudouridine synthase RsuA/RluA-like domain-containing protein n=1 Tax=Prorocentrum cordatum TaxID=2364126 RepID=A0ABN9UDP2_9DINO|nr:unnamed protein product [Polarella glacialis]